MKLFPAIDLRGGRVVRLTQGDYDRMAVYGDDPLATALTFREAGATYLHVVDLDGAKAGSPQNGAVIARLARESGLYVQAGGGLRTAEGVQTLLDAGVSRAILGTAALRDPDFLRAMLAAHGDKIAVGVDARAGKVAVGGWLTDTDVDALAFCEQLAELGVKTIIYTDIARDGGLSGVNREAYRALSSIAGLQVIASGGVTSLDDVAALRQMGLYGAIIGKALYEKHLDLAEALRVAE
ncbi:MAG: 1-(5-phosphoribosyl)-5-[(5-phosphoribosylamino)methylideneamino]imidazole-4-carboxamide isomerase [Oscillospiraceae bacterium]|jgi:phosphoribosylformimino-5-aminoimidazole carboxamide ribotide isomerase|nr:1-(5-phosphoribosyl)-5-[(5-phosphoribosylamino)methylideneamino]imidazole-4-carboxamide isomerase [Oscillospiraceae bacterium]